MAHEATCEGTFALTLTEVERVGLLGLLKEALGEARVEVHRTHTPGFREQVLREESMIRGLIDKLGGTCS